MAAKKSHTARSILSDAKKNPAPVYLFCGETTQTEALARRLAAILVPPEKQTTNLETYDGRGSPFASVLDSCRTVGLFGGRKVAWVREPTFFVAGDKKGDIADAALAAWASDRRKSAAQKLLVLATLSGWNDADLDDSPLTSLNKTKAKSFFGRDFEAAELEAADAIRAYAVEIGLSVASQRDDAALLEEFLASGAAGDTVLIFTCANADKRKRVFKQVEKIGVVTELSVERERSGAMKQEAVAALIAEAISARGKKLHPAALQLILKQAGSDPGPLQAELEKLCLYAGDNEVIETDDVKAIMRDLGESWIFDFTRALSQRNIGEALPLLRGLFAQGEPPLRLLAMMAREVRILLAAREILTTSLASTWTDRTTFNRFRDEMLGNIPEEQKQSLGGMHPYVLYLALQNAGRTSTERLEKALIDLHKLDVAFKSSRTDPAIRLEAFLLDMAR